MRYKGANTIKFSCDPIKNVTVVLGDNTVGKTTIAQAFRWGLYGAIFAEKGKKDDYQLLNYDVIEMMDANSRASVSIELEVEDDEKRYSIVRSIEYTRIFPKVEVREGIKKLKMKMSPLEDITSEIMIEDNRVQEVINELFPMMLSHYFLFDGERWSDITVNGVRENIKDSVHILTGLSSYQAAMNHLKDMGSNSVIRTFKSKITGTGSLYDNLEKDRNQMERDIEKCKEQIKTIDVNISVYQEKSQALEDYLETNKSTEVMQGKYKQLGFLRKVQEEQKIINYKMLVNEFSDKAYMLFAKPMIDAAINMIKAVAGERRDIPHMHQSSIDYIIKTRKCICGTPIRPDTKEFEALLEQRNYLPPADIGSLLGEFERTGRYWNNKVAEVETDILAMAQKVDDSAYNYEETCTQLQLLEQKMVEQTDFGEKRRQLKEYRIEMQKLSNQKGELQGKIQSFSNRIERIESEMRSQEAQNNENEKWRKRVAIAEQLYEKLRNDFSVKETKIFTELNAAIQNNFDRMFNAKDKKVQLTERYEIEMLYRTEQGYREEKNLSEGEKIARNFAFVVTIMEYSRLKKEEKQGREEGSESLPLVLDGPFSKLGDENIRLIAGVLPKAAEQVIIFMLKKDWKYTGLDEYVGASYFIDKEAGKTYASIRTSEV